jgi:hypothetical protein
MRDAFGGTFLMYLIIIFIVIYVTFLAAALKYLQAYRVKNEIINYIEQYEGFNNNVKEKLEGKNGDTGYLYSVSYNEKSAIKKMKYTTNIPTKANDMYCSKDYGYCITMEYYDNKQAYYEVTTYLTLDFTNILNLGPITIPVTGETRLVTVEGL